MEEEFDLAALNELIDQALAEEVVPIAKVTLALYEGKLMERLAISLPRHLGPNATRSVLRELRGELSVGQETTMPTLVVAVAACRRCPGLSPPSLPTVGNLRDPDLVVVIESLAAHDRDAIMSLLEEAGVGRNRVALTGATRCPGAVAPEDIERCGEFLRAEIEVLGPSLVLAVGGTVTQSLLGTDVKIGEARGTIWWSGPWAILPTYSPGFASRGGRAEADLRTDLAIARRYLDG